jgi:hypothetical protein
MENTIARTYRLKKTTVARLEQLAQQQDAWPGQLLEMLLDRSLSEVEAGKWKLRRQPIKYQVQVE